VERRGEASDCRGKSFAPGAIVAEVARRADISPGQISRWRQEVRAVSMAK
jgi:transposase-like protein